MPADHGTPNTGDERDREVEAVAAAYGREAFVSGDARLAAAAAIDALDAVRARSPQREDHEAAWPPERLMCSEHEDRKAIAYTARCAECSREFMAAPSPSRDGTVAVEDVAVRVEVIGRVHDWLAEHFPEAVEPFKAWAVGVSERTERIHDQATKEER